MKPVTKKNDPAKTKLNRGNWRGYFIYFNREDNRIFVPKRFGIGWTLNFASPFTYLVLAVLIVLILLITQLTGQ